MLECTPLFKSLGAIKQINSIIQQGCIKLIKSKSKNLYFFSKFVEFLCVWIIIKTIKTVIQKYGKML